MKRVSPKYDIDAFSEDETDYFKELLNIGHGHSASLVAELLEHFVTLNVPSIQFLNRDSFDTIFSQFIKSAGSYTTQSFWGAMSGQTFFIIDQSSMGNLRKIFEEDEVEDDDIVLELINIMNASLISRIALELGTSVTFDMPCVESMDSIKKMVKPMQVEYAQAIILTTVLNFKDIDVDIEMVIFMHNESIEWIHQTIKQKIAEFIEWN